MGKELAQTQTIQERTVQSISWNNPHSLCPEHRGPQGPQGAYIDLSTVDGLSQWELWLAPWVTLWRTMKGAVLRLEKVLQTPSLGGVRVAKPPLESLPLTPHPQKEHPHGQVQLLMLPLRAGETVLAWRRSNRNCLSTGFGSCALISWVYISFVSQDSGLCCSHPILIQLPTCLGTKLSL